MFTTGKTKQMNNTIFEKKTQAKNVSFQVTKCFEFYYPGRGSGIKCVSIEET